MGKPDFLGNWCLQRQPKKALDVKIGKLVMDIYEDEKFLRKALGKRNGKTQVCCLEKPYVITELQDFEQLEDVIFYIEIFNP